MVKMMETIIISSEYIGLCRDNGIEKVNFGKIKNERELLQYCTDYICSNRDTI